MVRVWPMRADTTGGRKGGAGMRSRWRFPRARARGRVHLPKAPQLQRLRDSRSSGGGTIDGELGNNGSPPNVRSSRTLLFPW